MKEKCNSKHEVVVLSSVLLVALGARGLFAESISLTPKDDVVAIVNAASAGSVLTLAEGTYALSGTIQPANDVAVVGAGADKTILDFQAVCRGVSLSATGVLLEGVAVSNAANSAASGGGVYMTAGTLRNCRITGCVVSGQNHGGGGIYMKDGLVENCEVDNCKFKNQFGHGNAVWMSGGTVTNCNIHANDGGYSDSSSVGNGGGVVYLYGGTLVGCRIHDNEKDAIPGVHQFTGSKAINCLIYNNTGKQASSGIYKEGGATYFCTIHNCVMTGDTLGKSGLFQKDGTTKSCIIWNSHPAGSTAGSVYVTGGTFANCVTEKAVKGATNPQTGDPQFVSAATDDFHLANTSSAAYQTGTPVAEVKEDLDGRPRDAEKPCIGAYEYNAGAETFELLLKLDQSEYPVGGVPRVEAIVTGIEEAPPIAWALDGEVLSTTDAIIDLPGLAAGGHTIVAAVDAGEGRRDAKSQAFAVRPLKVYVNSAGRGEYPFETYEKGTNSVEAAFAALWCAPNTTSEIAVASGVYTNRTAISFLTPVRMVGAGRDVTHIVCETRFTPFTVDNGEARICDLTIEDGFRALVLSQGEVSGCQFLNCGNKTGTDDVKGGGIKISGGLITNCLFSGCYSRSVSGGGGGAYLTGGTIAGCTFTNCLSGSSGGSGGGAVYLGGKALVTHSRFIDCGGYIPAFRNDGGTVRNVLVMGMQAGTTAVAWQDKGTIESCTITGNDVLTAKETIHVAKGVFLNNVVWGNSGSGELVAEEGVTVKNSCYPEAEEGESGNTAKDPQLKAGGVLKSCSPCRNAGETQPWMAGALDLRGNPRVLNGLVDMGCYEVPASGLILIMR